MAIEDKKLEECDNDESNNSSCEDSSCEDQNRRDFLGLVGAGCGIACVSYVGYTAINYMAPSQDAKADATVEIDISGLKEGAMMTVKWRGKPIFIKKRTEAEIKEAESVEISALPDPEIDGDRVFQNRKDILVLVGICTHLGCVPLGNQGNYHGWFCPCHGSHYDSSGRIRSGPAPKNLVVPPYHFASENKIIIGVGSVKDKIVAYDYDENTTLM